LDGLRRCGGGARSRVSGKLHICFLQVLLELSLDLRSEHNGSGSIVARSVIWGKLLVCHLTVPFDIMVSQVLLMIRRNRVISDKLSMILHAE